MGPWLQIFCLAEPYISDKNYSLGTKPTMRIRFLSATAILCAIFLAFSAAPNGRAAGNIFEHIAIPQEPTNWSGFYAGFNTGATWNHFDIGKYTSEVDLEDQFYQLEPFAVGVPFNNTATFSAPGHSNTENSPVGGGQMGFNFQFGHFVVGGDGGKLEIEAHLPAADRAVLRSEEHTSELQSLTN